MTVMRRPLAALTLTIAAVAAAPAVAGAMLSEVGRTGPEATASCPARPCLAFSRTTGFQAKIGERRGTHVVPRDGRIVAWTITLGKPGTKQQAFFERKLGGAASAQISVLDLRRKLRYRAVAQGEPQKLEPFFGTTVQFPLDRSIPVKKGQVVALTSTTWAPALAVGLGSDTSWRAARGRGKCEDPESQTAQTMPAQLAQYYCLYRTARLTYSYTLVSTP